MNCYRFPDRKTFYRLAECQGLLDEVGGLIECTHEHSIDEIGPIPPSDGWHINAIGMSPPEWEEFRVTPEHPVRVFAGCE